MYYCFHQKAGSFYILYATNDRKKTPNYGLLWNMRLDLDIAVM